MNEEGKALENYKAQLRRQEQNWHVRFEHVLHSDRAAVDIGMMAVRTAILMNAGAIVALLAFVGQLWAVDSERMAKVLDATPPFVWGLVSAAGAVAVAYMYQSLVTAAEQRNWAEVSEEAESLKPFLWVPRLTIGTGLMMVGLLVLLYIFFISGTFGIIDVLQQLSPA